jgi:hypothetical protein
MSGPRPLPAIAFRDLYEAVAKLRVASETPAQETIIVNLLAGLKQVEPQWHIVRFADGTIDTRRPINSAINPEGNNDA